MRFIHSSTNIPISAQNSVNVYIHCYSITQCCYAAYNSLSSVKVRAVQFTCVKSDIGLLIVDYVYAAGDQSGEGAWSHQGVSGAAYVGGPRPDCCQQSQEDQVRNNPQWFW